MYIDLLKFSMNFSFSLNLSNILFLSVYIKNSIHFRYLSFRLHFYIISNFSYNHYNYIVAILLKSVSVKMFIKISRDA